jgi:hypothetical protein
LGREKGRQGGRQGGGQGGREGGGGELRKDLGETVDVFATRSLRAVLAVPGRAVPERREGKEG